MSKKKVNRKFTCIPNHILEVLAPKPKLLSLYMVIKTYCISSTSTWVSQKTLADRLKVDVRTVRRNMVELQNLGIITRKSRGKGKSMLTILHHIEEDNNTLPDKEGGRTELSPSGKTEMSSTPRTKTSPRRILNEEDELKKNNNMDYDKEVTMSWKDDVVNLESNTKQYTDERRKIKEEKKKPIRISNGTSDKELSHKDLLESYKKVYYNIMGKYPRISPKEKKQAKLWLEERDAHECINMINHAGDNYSRLAEIFNWNNISFSLIYGFRDGIFIDMKKLEKKEDSWTGFENGKEWDNFGVL